MTTYREYLIKARDHHQRVGNHVGSYFGEYNLTADLTQVPCCMLGALHVASTPEGVSACYTSPEFLTLRTYLSSVVAAVTGETGVGFFSDNATDQERTDMWNYAITHAPDKEV